MSYTLVLLALDHAELAEVTAGFAAVDELDELDERVDELVEAVEAAGRPIGALGHSSSSGELFRDDFGRFAGVVFGPGVFQRLQYRELPGLTDPRPPGERDVYPTFGGLTLVEVRAALAAARAYDSSIDQDNNPLEADPDGEFFEEWKVDLDRALRLADAVSSDIVGIYT